jgi:NitT/TauT family transport system substrate-binding protein
MSNRIPMHAFRRAVMALLVTAATACAIPTMQAANAATDTVRVAYIPVATWVPMWIAKDKGIFVKNGLNVELTKFPNVSLLPQTVGKQFDLVPTTAPDLLNAAASGLDVVGVAGESIETSKNKSFQVIVRKDSGIESPKDLNGKRIASPGIGSVMHVATLHWMKINGGDPSTLKPVEARFPYMMDLLKSGRADAVEGLQPFVGQMLHAGYKSLGAPLLSVADPTIFPFWMAQGKWARAHRDIIKRWIASLDEALAILKSDDATARAITAKYTGLPEKIVARIPFPTFQFTIEPSQIAVWQKVLVEQGNPVGKLNVNDLIVTAP